MVDEGKKKGENCADLSIKPVMMDSEETKRVMEFEDKQYMNSTLQSLNVLRQNRQFCDIVLQIGKYEVHAHRAVLACASPYFFDLFTANDDGSHEFRCKLNGGFEKESFEKLVNYAYTARLDITEDQVKAIYMTANRLKMQSVVARCGLFLAELLSPDNCIGIRSISGVSSDVELIAKVDAFIEKEMANVVKSKELLQLPMVQVEILQKLRSKVESMNEKHLCNLVIEWIKQHVEDDALTLDLLTEKLHMLYIHNDNCLRDCNEIQTGDANDSEIIQDYKRMSKKHQIATAKPRKKNSTPAPPKPRQFLYSHPATIPPDSEEYEWKVVSCINTGEYSVMAIVTLGGRLARVSVMLRLNSSEDHHVTPTTNQNGEIISKAQETYRLLPPMSSARCAVGAADLNGQLLVCGGYDRGECLKSAQLYDPSSNTWTVLSPMLHSRGRFDLTVVADKAYAVGGSDGSRELASVEYYDTAKSKWAPVSPLPMARSNAGVCSLEGKVYCIGGWNGQVGIKRCDVYETGNTKWTEIAPLITGRYQAGACALKGCVYAVGGCDAWNCLNSVEKYDPQTDSWSFVAPLHTARRGSGVAAYNGKLYAVGGGDGVHSLCSVEIYDPETNTWSPGPSLTSCRANVGVAVVGTRLYAVGGFTGKTFLNTIEYLDPQTNEWTTFTAMMETSSFPPTTSPPRDGLFASDLS